MTWTCRPAGIRSSGRRTSLLIRIYLEWMFSAALRAGVVRSPFAISDVWPSSYSSNTNEILWDAKTAARVPWITCVIRLASYECGMDQPTYTPVQQIVERSGTLFFSFQDLDATKPAGAVKIRSRPSRTTSSGIRAQSSSGRRGGRGRTARSFKTRVQVRGWLGDGESARDSSY